MRVAAFSAFARAFRSISCVMSTPITRPVSPTARAARKQSKPAPLPRSRTVSPGRNDARAIGFPQPNPRFAPPERRWYPLQSSRTRGPSSRGLSRWRLRNTRHLPRQGGTPATCPSRFHRRNTTGFCNRAIPVPDGSANIIVSQGVHAVCSSRNHYDSFALRPERRSFATRQRPQTAPR